MTLCKLSIPCSRVRHSLGRFIRSSLAKVRSVVMIMVAVTAVTAANAQIFTDPVHTGPRGLTDTPSSADRAASAPERAEPASEAAGREEKEPQRDANALAPLPPDPLLSTQPIVFGSQMFVGRFGGVPFSGFNPDYQISVGDKINVRMWGAFDFDSMQTVDPQGNIFIPNVGPVAVLGVRNSQLNQQVEARVKQIFRSNVGVYATLSAAQPVKIYVTGFVKAPGLYSGLSSDSVLHYLDQAGGIDPERGSFLEVVVLRAGKVRATIDLYAFLLHGRMEHLQLQDGDTIVVQPRKRTAQVRGAVLNPYIFEFNGESVPASELIAVASPRPGATHLSIVRKAGRERRSEYHPLADAARVTIQDGDEITVTSDRYPGTILVRVEGAHVGEASLILPYGSRLRDALERIRPTAQANIGATQLFRRSVARRQREMLAASLRSLETYSLTARSATSEEAALRAREAALILQFIERARTVQPRGQVVLADQQEALDTLLEDGDVLRVPEKSNLVLVHGEVLFPNALVYQPSVTVDDYVQRSGGYNQGANKARLIVIHQDGRVSDGASADLRPGDEIMVLPRIETKSVEVTRGITQILYQIAVSARVLLGL